ncbi:hypothetical protein HCN44_007269 [Aphidius gifuensis]|uniref:Uncharacterized protein n=1 Tax=Aphidius gifuensis TaxID=684658 RepID=A0A834XPB2_APHGI|nr:exosome complex component MTR3-like [Aphidius gifuensis]KAF7988959.1 hypothetical protein HCN44_007269 [Aphidius gifuensis]
MPIDQKRINGPEVSIPYQIYVDSSSKETEKRKNLLLKREDGRKHSEIRKMFVKAGIVSQAKGSAYIEIGKTKVICTVFDPREIPNKSGYSLQGNLYCEFKYASFSCKKRKIHQQDNEEKEFSMIMQRSLEPSVCRHEFPNFQVDIYALVLDNDGSCLSTAITAASLALANASIPMFGLVTAVTAGIYNDKIFIDPTIDEEELCLNQTICANDNDKITKHGLIMQACLPQHEQIAELHFIGDINLNDIQSILNNLTDKSKDISLIIQQRLVKSVVNNFNEKSKIINIKKE